MSKLIGAIIALLLVFAIVGSLRGDPLTREAKVALRERGLVLDRSERIDGEREAAICGVASGRRFLHRAIRSHPRNATLVEGDLPPAMFSALHAAWCE